MRQVPEATGKKWRKEDNICRLGNLIGSSRLRPCLLAKKNIPRAKNIPKKVRFGYVFSFTPNPSPPQDVYCGPEILSYLVQYFCPTTTFHHKNCSIIADVDNVTNDSSSSSRPLDANSSSADGKFMIEEGSAKEGWAVYCISWYGCVSRGVPWTKSGE
jgi:hypothetical protein